MRRKDREVTDPKTIRTIIESCHCCRIGLCDHGKAYILPMDFGFTENNGHYTLYFHSAREGRKINLLREQGWASFEMDTGHETVPDDIACEYTARFQSVMGGGPVTFLETPEEKRAGLTALMNHAAGPGEWIFGDASVDAVQVIALDVEELTCKVHP